MIMYAKFEYYTINHTSKDTFMLKFLSTDR